MAHEKNDPKKPAGAAGARTKRPTTIDLKATEIKPEPAGKPEQPAADESQPHPEPVTAKAVTVDMPQAAPKETANDMAMDASGETSKEAVNESSGDSAKETPRDSAKAAAADLGRAAEAAGPPVAGGAAQGTARDWPWSSIGLAAAAAIVFFAIGLGAGQWLASLSLPAAAPVTAGPSPELLARLDKMETQIRAPRTEDQQLQARLGKIESALSAPAKDDPQLQARLAKVEAQLSAPRADDHQVMARIAAAEAAVKTLADMTAAREKRSDDIAALARDARDRASTAVSAAEAAQRTQAVSPEARADIDALTTRIAALEKSAQSSQAELARRLTADDAKGRFAIAAIALRDAVDSGVPFTAELAAVKSLSGDANAVVALEPFAASGVPSTEALGRELAGLMPAIWKAARKEQPQQTGTFLERLQSNAEKIVRIRPAGDVAGDDPASIRSRIETRAGTADIRGALAELAKLPPDARAPAEAWMKKAQARDAALAAARNISQTALGALVKPGS